MSPLYCVTITRETDFYVDAPDKASAQEDAKELVATETDIWDDADDSLYLYEVPGMPEQEYVWVGGDDGEWMSGLDRAHDILEAELEAADDPSKGHPSLWQE